ncbi:MAG: nuclear transport factor 2 family protein [Bacteroidota bacterium]
MKKSLINFTMIFLFGLVSLTGCKNSREFGDKEKLAVTDTINQLMDQVMKYSAMANADSALQWISDDSAAVFTSGGLAFSAREILSLFKNTYSTIKSQEFEMVSSRVIVISPDAAVWIGTVKDKSITKEDEVIDQFLQETWVWRREVSGWRVAHYHESILSLPDACKRATVENALGNLAKEINGKVFKPADMPAILTEFLKQNALIYGSAYAFAPAEEKGTKQMSAPYVYRQGNEFKSVDLPASYDYTLTDWYAIPVANKKPSWSNPYYDDGGGGVAMVTYSIPVYDKQNNLLGVLTSDLEIK